MKELSDSYPSIQPGCISRREELHAALEHTSSEDFLLLFSDFTGGIRISTSVAIDEYEIMTSRDEALRVHNPKLRTDMELVMAKGQSIFQTLEPDKQTDFLSAMIERSALVFAADDDRHGYKKGTFAIRNALYDIVADCRDPLDPSTIMATRFLKGVLEHPDCKDSVKKTARLVLRDPSSFTKNPELLFMLQESLPKRGKRREAEDLAGGTVKALFELVEERGEPGTYPRKLADAYRALVDKQYGNIDGRSNLRAKPSEGGVRYMPTALVSLAKLVAKNNGDKHAFTDKIAVTDFPRAFDYLLPQLELDKVYPGLDSKTIDTIKRALSEIIHRTAASQ